jgi:hypothetical protein
MTLYLAFKIADLHEPQYPDGELQEFVLQSSTTTSRWVTWENLWSSEIALCHKIKKKSP